METITHYVYLIHPREHIRMNEPVYKIGRTTQTNIKRFKNYPKGSKLLLQVCCEDSCKCETSILKLFKEKYIQRREFGNEYFEGSFIEMMKDIHSIAMKDIEPITIKEVQPITVKEITDEVQGDPRKIIMENTDRHLKNIAEETEKYRSNNDHYSMFIKEFIEPAFLSDGETIDPKTTLNQTDLYNLFKWWFQDSFPDIKLLDSITVRGHFERILGVRRGRRWEGIKFRSTRTV